MLATIPTPGNPSAAPNLDIRNVHLISVDNLYLKVALEGRGAMLTATDPAIDGLAYFVCLDKNARKDRCPPDGHNDVIWTVRGFGGRRAARSTWARDTSPTEPASRPG